MAEASSSARANQEIEEEQLRELTTAKVSFAAATSSSTVVDKTLSSASNLMKLLPTGTVMAFQALAPSFTNKGACYTSNRCITAALIFACAASCVLFSFTDSFLGTDGKLYYGLATTRGFLVFNYNGTTDDDGGHRAKVLGDLKRLRIRFIDYLHAVFSLLLFLALTFSDTGVQGCFFPDAGPDAKELLVNLPLGAGVLSAIIFLIFPTSRKSIGYSDSQPPTSSTTEVSPL